MLPLALIVVILGGAGSLLGAFVGSFVVGFLYNFGIALFPDLAYFILFLPMVLVLVFMPQGLFGRVAAMSRTAIASLVIVAVVRWRVPLGHHQRLLRQSGEPDPDLRAARAEPEPAARLRRHGIARPCRLPRPHRLLRRAAGARRLRPAHHRDPARSMFSTACGALFGVLALRATGIGFLMITLALGQIVWGIAYRANTLTGGDNGITLPARPMPVRHRHQFRAEFLLFHPDRVCDRAVLHLAADALAVRREPDGHARPAAPHVACSATTSG